MRMRHTYLFPLVIVLVSGCLHQSYHAETTTSPATGETGYHGRLNDKQLAVFIDKAIAVAEANLYSHPDGSGAECGFLGDYDRTIAPRCYQWPDGSHVSVELTYYRSLSGHSGTLLRLEFDVRTGEVTKSAMETFVSDTL
jgi:hypothetical protein